MLKNVIDQYVDKDGYSYGEVEPGFCVHQAVLTGSHNYMLHYNITAVEDHTIVAYISKNDFECALQNLNLEMI